MRREQGEQPSTVEENKTGECVIARYTLRREKKVVLALLSSLSVPYEMKTIPTGSAPLPCICF